MVYLSSSYDEEYDLLVDALRKELPGLRNVYGCTGFGIIGVDGEGAHEVEGAPALSLTLATIPQAEVIVRHVDAANLPDGDAPPGAWSTLLGVPAFPEQPLALVLLAHPTFQPVYDLLAGLDFAFPNATKLGGLASAVPSLLGYPTATVCWSAAGGGGAGGEGGRGVHRSGVAVLAVHGEVHMDLIIAQGCRPLSPVVWTVAEVAEGDRTRVTALSSERVGGGRPLPALQAFQVELQSVLGGMSETQLRRTVSNLTVGIAPDSGLVRAGEQLEPQDFLIRMLGGFDSQQALIVGDKMRPGQRLRFMVRDKQGAQEDLQAHGTAYKRRQLQAMLEAGSAPQPQPFGMFMFTCNGRGSGLYGEESYDARTMSSFVSVPCAGFQCNGEIGRVGGTTHLHGFTCAVGVLRLTAEAMAGASGSPAAADAPTPAPAPDPQQQP
ncbi:hypothetical protein GPECTOR_1g41 [Gonium pectorale]|uniref:FIST C-domain domain-containing protein n=1 Tax=Gonium pectorale TaxID=33097 RepID=A0A150H3Q5_GONPE|nr:hypothetical protein GPECTOR_1g41 [Gonium pectorale]|eukprot:KXZ56458.1 hypothetical protein GPECTOR_1g41 [Gonium pectorale]